MKVNQLLYENVHMITDLPTKRILAISQWQMFLTVLPTRWRQKSTGIDIVQSYVTVTLVGLVAEWLACWTQAQKGPGSNRSRDAVG